MLEIEKYKPCQEAIEFRSKYVSFEDAWNNCHRGDWMLWIAKELNVDEKLIYKTKACCALTVIHLMKDERSKKACIAALEYGEGKISKEELHTAASAAAYYASVSAAKKENKMETAEICRKILTKEVFKLINKTSGG